MLADDFDTFLQLLTTQLRNQDPLEPMDTNQFTQQLVQFSGVEQQIQTNSYLENLITSTEAQSVNAAVNYLGSTVTVAGVIHHTR
jgi:flagellar basal-body rod modification protein FlgD